MKTVLALDLGTTTGWAIGSSPLSIISGVMKLQPGRFDSASMRFIRFVAHLNGFTVLHPIDFVVYEEVRSHKGTDAAHIYGGLMAHLQVWAEERGIPYEGVPVSTIKRWATGKGNAGKPEMIRAMQALGHKPADDNEADALALCRLKLQELSDVHTGRTEQIDFLS